MPNIYTQQLNLQLNSECYDMTNIWVNTVRLDRLSKDKLGPCVEKEATRYSSITGDGSDMKR